MDIIWYGRSCFLLKASDVNVLADPLDAAGKPREGLPAADVVTLSHWAPGDDVPEPKARKKVVRSPGEFEIGGAFITAVRSFRDSSKGNERGVNLVYRFTLDNVRICHLGLIGHVPQPEHATAIGDIDVLLLPVGPEGLAPARAAETVNLLEPKIVVPYSLVGQAAAADIQTFVTETGLASVGPQAKLTATRASVQQASQVVLLEPISS